MSFTEILRQGKTIAGNKQILIFIPLVLDLLLFGPLAFSGLARPHLKFTIPTSLPTVMNLLPNAAYFADGPGLGAGYPGTLTSGFVGLLVTFLLLPFITGGYLGTIAEEIRQPENRTPFIALCSRCFTRLFSVRILAVAAFYALLSLPMLLPFLAGFMAVIMLFAAILMLFWDFNIVYYNLALMPALKLAYTVCMHHYLSVARAFLPAVLLLAPTTLLTSVIMSTPLLFVVIVLYVYAAAIFVSGAMKFCVQLAHTQK